MLILRSLGVSDGLRGQGLNFCHLWRTQKPCSDKLKNKFITRWTKPKNNRVKLCWLLDDDDAWNGNLLYITWNPVNTRVEFRSRTSCYPFTKKERFKVARIGFTRRGDREIRRVKRARRLLKSIVSHVEVDRVAWKYLCSHTALHLACSYDVHGRFLFEQTSKAKRPHCCRWWVPNPDSSWQNTKLMEHVPSLWGDATLQKMLIGSRAKTERNSTDI